MNRNKSRIVGTLMISSILCTNIVFAMPVHNIPDSFTNNDTIVTVDTSIPIYKSEQDKKTSAKVSKVIKNNQSIKVTESENKKSSKDEEFSVKISEFLDNAHNKSAEHLLDSEKLSDDRLFDELYYEIKVGSDKYTEYTNKYKNIVKMPGKPYIKKGKTMIPVKMLGEIANCTVDYSKDTLRISNNYNKYTLYGKKGSNKLIKDNGKEFLLDNPIENKKDVNYIEISVLEDIWGIKIESLSKKPKNDSESNTIRKIQWFNDEQTIRIYPIGK